jgi:hypothetical protein
MDSLRFRNQKFKKWACLVAMFIRIGAVNSLFNRQVGEPPPGCILFSIGPIATIFTRNLRTSNFVVKRGEINMVKCT